MHGSKFPGAILLREKPLGDHIPVMLLELQSKNGSTVPTQIGTTRRLPVVLGPSAHSAPFSWQLLRCRRSAFFVLQLGDRVESENSGCKRKQPRRLGNRMRGRRSARG